MNRTIVVVTLIIVGGVGFVVLTHLNPDAPATATVMVTLLFTQVVSVLAFFNKADRTKAEQEAKLKTVAEDVSTIKTNTNGTLTEYRKVAQLANERAELAEKEVTWLRAKLGMELNNEAK